MKAALVAACEAVSPFRVDGGNSNVSNEKEIRFFTKIFVVSGQTMLKFITTCVLLILKLQI